MKSKGKGCIVMPLGVLFRGNAEADIRKKIIDKGYIKPTFSAHLADDGAPCLSLDFEEAPQCDFDKIL